MISLLYAGNEAVVRGLLISALSVAKNTSQALDVHLLTMDLSDRDAKFRPLTEETAALLQDSLCRYCPESRVTRYDLTALFEAELSQSPNLANFYTPYALLRLFADEVPTLPERLIYLDTDTAACGDLNGLFTFDLRGCEYAATRDYLGRVFIHPNYINTGVLLLDLRRIRETGLFARARRFVAEKKRFFPDQDALNRMVQKKRYFPRCYNEQRRMRRDTVVRHFSKSIRWFPFYHTVNIKPWETERLHTVYKTFAFDGVLAECEAIFSGFSGDKTENPRRNEVKS